MKSKVEAEARQMGFSPEAAALLGSSTEATRAVNAAKDEAKWRRRMNNLLKPRASGAVMRVRCRE